MKTMQYAMAAVLLLATACTNDDPAPETTPEPTPEPIAAHTIIYTAGTAWDPMLPPEQQDLAAHFAYIEGLFNDGVLLANGPFLDDGRGFYIHLAEAGDMDQLVTDDPAVQSNVLALDESAGWSLLMDNLGADIGAGALFVLEYTPGASWEEGKPLGEQDIGAHVDYVGGLFGDGTLIAGGP